MFDNRLSGPVWSQRALLVHSPLNGEEATISNKAQKMHERNRIEVLWLDLQLPEPRQMQGESVTEEQWAVINQPAYQKKKKNQHVQLIFNYTYKCIIRLKRNWIRMESKLIDLQLQLLSLSTQNKLICHLKDVRSIFRSPDHSEGLFCVDILLHINIYIEMSQ